jgi:hypothetical protein
LPGIKQVQQDGWGAEGIERSRYVFAACQGWDAQNKLSQK